MVSSLITPSRMVEPTEGTSNMMSSIACSRMALNPRAPDLCFCASEAMADSAPLAKRSLTPPRVRLSGRREHGQPPHDSRNLPVLQQLRGLPPAKEPPAPPLFLRLDLG